MAEDRTIVGSAAPPVTGDGDLTDELISTSEWTDGIVSRAGIPIVDVPFVTVGGGFGSFAMVDYLRVAGVPTSRIKVLGDSPDPWTTYEYLTNNSQIPRQERLRSDSGSVLDNVWGFPSYAVREAWADRSLKQLWHVMAEPYLGQDYYTPKAGQVFESVKRETARIGWDEMIDVGVVRMVRKRRDGGYFALHTPADGPKRVAYRCNFLHLAVGYPGVKFLDDLQAYRDGYQDFQRVVNAYEPHAHVYEECKRRQCTVLVRGSGIVSSRVLQRIIDDRDKHGAQTRIVHLFRNYVSGPQGDSIFFRRPGANGFAYQGFNFAKSAWGGQYRLKMERMEGETRKNFLEAMGGTNTAPRRSWKEQIRRGMRDGFYFQEIGEVETVAPSADGRAVVTTIRNKAGDRREIDAQFIVDATGLEGNIEDHRLLNDLLMHSGAQRNPKGRLDIEPSFEVRNLRSRGGRMYASGSATLGGYYAGVDSFLGLQYAALRIADDLADAGFHPKLGPGRSISQWFKWMRNTRI
ncbi:MAG: hypothetical protein AB7V62_07425 [Thermoleophilia bacterium]